MTIRSFFALPLSIECETALLELTDGLAADLEKTINPEARIRWVPSANYHLTLAFLGDIEHRDLEALHSIAQTVASSTRAGQFRLRGFEWFPSALKPRMLVAVPEPCEPLIALQRQLSRELHRAGFHIEKRPFRPHVTLARLRELVVVPDLSGQIFDLDGEIDELVLFSSSQECGSSVYSPLLVEPIGA